MVDLLLSVSVPYQFVQVNLRWLPAVVATSLSNLSCKAHGQEGSSRSQSFYVIKKSHSIKQLGLIASTSELITILSILFPVP